MLPLVDLLALHGFLEFGLWEFRRSKMARYYLRIAQTGTSQASDCGDSDAALPPVIVVAPFCAAVFEVVLLMGLNRAKWERGAAHEDGKHAKWERLVLHEGEKLLLAPHGVWLFGA